MFILTSIVAITLIISCPLTVISGIASLFNHKWDYACLTTCQISLVVFAFATAIITVILEKCPECGLMWGTWF